MEILITDFVENIGSPEIQNVLKLCDEKRKIFGALLDEKAIDDLKRTELDRILKNLVTVEAYQIYNSIINKYGFESFTSHLKYFLYGSDPLEIRFDTFFTDIPELPQLALMEISTFAQPKNFCIWDDGAKKTVQFLGQGRMHGLSESSFHEEIKGIDYVWAKLALNQIRQAISAYLNRKIDFVDVFVFTTYVHSKWVSKFQVGKNR